MSHENLNILIIGNGIAGLSAAKSIRKKDLNCKITMISNEPYLTYFRPQLTNFLSSDDSENKLLVSQEKWYKENNIELMLNKNVNKIIPEKKEIILLSGEKISYDKLILANGSSNFIPPTKGAHKKGVFTLRTLDDAKNIKTSLKNAKSVVIVGGGLLGLEAASEANKLGVNVHIIERNPILLSKQLDKKGGELFKELISPVGIDIISEDPISEIIGDEKVSSVKLSSGKEISCDIVLFSIGIRPNINLAKEAEISVNKGILVNTKMQTTLKNIYACGDCAEINGNIFGLWTAAMEMGRVAGENSIGTFTEFKHNYTPQTMLNAMNVKVFSIGDVTSNDLKSYEVNDVENKIYKKLFFRDGKIVGGYLINDIKASSKLTMAIQQGTSMIEAKENNLI